MVSFSVMAIMAYNITIKPKIMIEVAIVAFEGISLFHLSVPIAVFQDAMANHEKLFNVSVCSELPGKITSANNLGIEIENHISVIENADIVIIPSWIPATSPSPMLISQLLSASQSGKAIVGLCLGAYALAYSGLLNHKRATTHWQYVADFRQRFPQVNCDSNPLYIQEDNIITSAGSAAAIDCCLHIVKQQYGVKIANKVARTMVSSPERPGGQNQYIETPIIARPSDNRIAELVDHIMENIAEPFSLKRSATFCMMSVRSFSRHFAKINGISFTNWLINTRLNASLEMLEATDLAISTLSDRAGFSSEQIFRKHFKQRFDTTPQAWRKLFRSRA